MLFHFDRRKKSEKEKKPPRFLVLRRKWLTLGAAVLAIGFGLSCAAAVVIQSWPTVSRRYILLRKNTFREIRYVSSHLNLHPVHKAAAGLINREFARSIPRFQIRRHIVIDAEHRE